MSGWSGRRAAAAKKVNQCSTLLLPTIPAQQPTRSCSMFFSVTGPKDSGRRP